MLGDLETLHHWLNLSHLKPFYTQEPVSTEEVRSKYRPRVESGHPTRCKIVCAGAVPFGYCQWYLNQDYPDYGASVIGKSFGFSVDYFIGEPNYLGKGLGSAMLKLLIDQIFPLLSDKDQLACIGHDDRNRLAIRCTMRAGFKKDRHFVEDGVPSTLYCFR